MGKFGIRSFYRNVREVEADRGVDLALRGGITVTIRRAGGANRLYAQAMTEKARPFTGTVLDDATSRRLTAEVFAETIVTGWSGVLDEDGGEIPFSRDAATQLFTEVPEFLDDVANAAYDEDRFRTAAMKAAAKN